MNNQASPTNPSQPVKTLMRWPVAAIERTLPLREVASALVADELGALAVVDNDALIGVISERDVVRETASGADPEHTLARDMLSADLVTVTVDDTLEAAARLMVEAGIRHLPVVDGSKVVGFLSIRDLLGIYLDQ